MEKGWFFERINPLERVSAILERALKPSGSIEGLPPCEIYNDEHYARFIRVVMGLHEESALKDHIEKQDCLSCQNGLIKAYETFMKVQDEAEERMFYARTMKLLDKISKG